ncbi:glycosyltransferase family 4 protein [candidate division WOR-3 bacterium]|nr:glycosyltransferase family 4 protein [candidate division WOR-3 bacterium]
MDHVLPAVDKMRKKLKILILSDVYYPTPGGVSEHIYNFAKNMRQRGHKVVIVAPKVSRKKSPEHDFDVLRAGKAVPVRANKSVAKVTVGARLYWEVKDIVRSENWDIIHTHGPYAPVLPYLGQKFNCRSALLGDHVTAKIATFHASYRRVLPYEIFKAFLQKPFSKIDGLIAVSEEAKESVEKYLKGNFRIIPNGVDSNYFNPDLPRVDKFSENDFNIFFAGRFDPRKGVTYLVKGFYFILKFVPDAKLWIGGGDKYRKLGLDFIMSRLKAKNPVIASRVEYLKFIPYAELPRYFASADIFCSPAIGGESFGIVLIEAMACGTPVVASNIAGYKEVVSDNKDGLLFKPRDIKDLARKVVTLAKDRQLRKKMGENGRKKVLEKYSWDKVTDSIEDYYYEVLEKKSNEQKSCRGGNS